MTNHFSLPSLSYEYHDLEPYFDSETMKIHHSKHHQAYISNTNKIIKNVESLSKLSIDSLIQNLDKCPINYRTILRNNAGGHANHSLFWKGLKIGTNLHGTLAISIYKHFGSFEVFKKEFEQKAIDHFGSGWVWLVKKNDTLSIISTNNQDNPLMNNIVINNVHYNHQYGYPILGLDIWEHAYYLKYKNNKIEYIKSFWYVLNWDEALKRFEKV